MRLFVALETPPDVRTALAGLRERFAGSRADVRWEPDEKLHATLKFLGETPDGLLPALGDVLLRIGERHPPVRTRYRGIGCFPSLRAPRVVWAGMDDPDNDLARLAADLEEAAAGLGFKREDRRFSPHVTLGRVRGPAHLDRLRSLMESVTFDGPPVTLHDMCLIRSFLRPQGSAYSTVQVVPLVGNRTDTR